MQKIEQTWSTFCYDNYIKTQIISIHLCGMLQTL